MRLQPIENPKGLKLRLAYWFARRTFGKVITPMKVVTARVPQSMRLSYEMAKLMEHGFSLPQDLQMLLHVHISEVNQCHFCVDIGKAMAMKMGGTLDKLNKLECYKTDPAFTPAERAALAYVEEVSQTKDCSEATFAELKKHFTETQIAEITLLNALENTYNLTNRPLRIESDGLCALAARSAAAK